MNKISAADLLAKYGALDEAQELGLSPTQARLDSFITTDPDIISIKSKITKLAPTDIPILILGETGTGKELIAEALHGNRKGEFIPINCAGIPDTLLESEFFGVDRGAFTGATERRGLIEEANNGTLFLDEIGDMPTILQSKLLRALQSKKFRRIGGNSFRPLTARIIAATNVSEEQLLKFKRFRADLYYRLSGYVIKLPPLRERPTDDIIRIVNKFAASPDIAVDILSGNMQRHQWPGNVRELINYIQAQNILYDSEQGKTEIINLKPIESKLV